MLILWYHSSSGYSSDWRNAWLDVVEKFSTKHTDYRDYDKFNILTLFVTIIENMLICLVKERALTTPD